jgi:hypothetical protein
MKRYFLLVLPVLFVLLHGCKSVAKFPMDEPLADYANDYIIGKWKPMEDSDKNNFFEITKAMSGPKYHVKYWNRGGTNPTYEANVFFSKINNYLFLNVPYWHENRDDRSYYQASGYFFVKIINVNSDHTKMTTATIRDTTLGSLASSLEVYNRTAKNLNNRFYYSDTVHFIKL